MIKRSTPVYLNLTIAFLGCLFLNPANPTGETKTIQQNQPPLVKIISPKNNSPFDWNMPVNYEISVADKEDGNSKYDEINAKEVLLEVQYVARKAKVQAILNKRMQNDPPGLMVTRTSNCFNCHNFNSKSIGPSFYDISKRYPATKSNIDSLTKHIILGSSGIWGKEKMPTHAELTAGETKSAVQWILKNSNNPDVNYYIGLQGLFIIKPPVASIKKGIYILTASYVDHGLKNAPGQRLKGQDMTVVYGK